MLQPAPEFKESKDNCYFRAFPIILPLNLHLHGWGWSWVAPLWPLENVTLFSGQTRWLYLDVGNLPEYAAKISILLGSADAEGASQRHALGTRLN